MCDLKYIDKENTHNLFKSTNISPLFRSFIIDKASEMKRNICAFKKNLCIYIYIYIYIYVYIYIDIDIYRYIDIYVSV